MRLRLLFLTLPVLAAACAMDLPANPDRVTLRSNDLAVHFFDGSVCRADIAAAPSGRFAACAQQMDYKVTVHSPSLAAGTVLETMMEPYATIELFRPQDNRRWTWQTPNFDGVNGMLESGTVKHR